MPATFLAAAFIALVSLTAAGTPVLAKEDAMKKEDSTKGQPMKSDAMRGDAMKDAMMKTDSMGKH